MKQGKELTKPILSLLFGFFVEDQEKVTRNTEVTENAVNMKWETEKKEKGKKSSRSFVGA